MNSNLTIEEIEDYRASFESLDIDGSGTISATELSVLLSSLGRKPSKAELSRIMACVDTDGSGTVDFDEFLEMMSASKGVSPIDTLKEIFKEYDQDGDGLIQKKELQKMFFTLCDALTQEEVDALINCCEKNAKNGKIDVNVFIQSVAK